MLETHTYAGTTWVRLINPTADHLAEITKKYQVEPEALRDIASPSPQQKVETYEDSMYVVFHIPAYKHSHSKGHIQEIDFIIGKDYVITIQYDTIDALQKFSKEAELKSLVGKEDTENITPGVIFVEVLRALYDSVEDEILFIGDQLRNIEDRIFSGRERAMVEIGRAHV